MSHGNLSKCLHIYWFYFLSDGASAHFKSHANILNLVYHRTDFGVNACWTFTASGHGKGAGDGTGAVLKSIARHATLSKTSYYQLQKISMNFLWIINLKPLKDQTNKSPVYMSFS